MTILYAHKYIPVYICRDALTKLSQGHKLKCPYCPVEQNPTDARQIFF